MGFRRRLLGAAALIVAVLGVGAVPARADAPYPIRGIFDRDFSPTGFDDLAALGFNFIDSNPYPEQVQPLAANGLSGFMWLGGYDNATCTFNRSDDWVRLRVGALAGKPGVEAYLIDDEPDAERCPTAPAQLAARSALVKSIDPGRTTFAVIYKNEQLERFAGSVDVIAIDKYTCSFTRGCDYSKIDDAAAEADRLGIRYWGVLQAFADDWYRLPSPAELHQQFEHWRATGMEGYLVFAWHWPTWDSALWLANQPALQRQLAIENARPAPVITRRTFLPTADARVAEAEPSSRLGTQTRLGSDGDAGARVASVLRFSLSGLVAPVQSARLWLYIVSDPTRDGPAVYPTAGSWVESSVTWAARPEPRGPAVADMGAVGVGAWAQLDVTPLVRGDGVIDLLLQQTGTDGVSFYAREGRHAPRLVVTSGSTR